MRRVVIAATLALLATPLDAQWPGSRVAVVAYRDTPWLTLCPDFGREVRQLPGRINPYFFSTMGAKALVSYDAPGQQAVALFFEPGVVGRTVLPRPGGPLPADYALQPDPAAKREMEEALGRRTPHPVVPSPEAADYVLIVQSSYADLSRAMARTRDTGQGRGEVDWIVRSNAGGMFRHNALAMLVPIRAYREHPHEAAVLIASSMWHGMVYSAWGTRKGVETISEAALVGLADQLVGQAGQLPDYLPLCAVKDK